MSMWKRYFIKLAYEGTNYSGWQRQPNALTVQECIENKLSILLKSESTIMGCGRTDAGVHATQFYAHVDIEGDIDLDVLKFKLNNMLPDDILILEVFPVTDDMHARYSATARSYIYTLTSSKPLFDRSLVYHFYRFDKLDHDKMHLAAKLIGEYRDFDSFCKTGTDVKTKICNIYESRIDITNKQIKYHVSANRFLRGMVRLLVGMILNVGLAKLDIQEVESALKNKSRLSIDWSVPARGLSLSAIRYPDLQDYTNDGSPAATIG